MKNKLSIVIPTINRVDYLRELLTEILPLTTQYPINICVSANYCSDNTHSYLESVASKYKNLIVSFHTKLQTIDENMIYAISLADGDYVLPLGDDDFASKESIVKILNLLDESSHDMILLNCIHTDENLHYIKSHLPVDLLGVTFNDPSIAFEKIWNLMPFGSFLASREVFNLKYATRYIGTSHAYTGIVWDSLASKFNQKSIEISVYCMPQETICLRGAIKTWESTKLIILYSEIPLWFNLIAVHKLYQKTAFRSLCAYQKNITSTKSILRNYFSSKDFYILKSLPILNICFFNKLTISAISFFPRNFTIELFRFLKDLKKRFKK